MRYAVVYDWNGETRFIRQGTGKDVFFSGDKPTVWPTEEGAKVFCLQAIEYAVRRLGWTCPFRVVPFDEPGGLTPVQETIPPTVQGIAKHLGVTRNAFYQAVIRAALKELKGEVATATS